MTKTTARCDHIVALIDACLAEVEATQQPAAITGSYPASIRPSTLAAAAQR
jgi:hypothetical protein